MNSRYKEQGINPWVSGNLIQRAGKIETFSDTKASALLFVMGHQWLRYCRKPLLICKRLTDRSSSPLESMFSDTEAPSFLREA
jgi:hypothetical protein